MLQLDSAWLSGCERKTLWRSDVFKLYSLTDRQTGEKWEALTTSNGVWSSASLLEDEFASYKIERAAWMDIPFDLIRTGDETVLLYEDASVAPLAESGSAMTVKAFLDFAVSAARALIAAHGDGYIHAPLHPLNLATDETGAVRLRALGTRFQIRDRASVTTENKAFIEDLRYHAPEQLRSMDPASDHRSDLYSLGVIFYRLLVGQFPFRGGSTAEWRHAHLAVEPYDSGQLRRDIPPILGRMLSHLLVKDPAQRYQTAASVYADLSRCRDELVSRGEISEFELGTADVPLGQAYAHALFGRSREEADLLGVVEQFEDSREGTVVFVSGTAGIGKSALVNSIRKRTAVPIIFAYGKSDQQQRDIPYSPMVQMLRSIVEQAMQSPEPALSELRHALLNRLDTHARLIVDLVPTMELIVGAHPPMSDVPPHPAQIRLQKALVQTLAVLASRIAPLALFMDDLQWADQPTIAVLKLLVIEKVENVLLLAAYREEESTSLLSPGGFVTHVRNSTIPYKEIAIVPISKVAAGQLIASGLNAYPSEIASLTDLLYAKTAGNPFFLRQLLQALIEERVIDFSISNRSPRWNADDVKRYPASDNVVEFMLRRLGQMDPESREILRFMACIGPRSPERLLCAVAAVDLERLHDLSQQLVDSGLVDRIDGYYRFSHDRVQEAAYALFSNDERAAAHAGVAEQMIDLNGVETSDAAFAAASQIERCDPTELSKSQRKRFVEVLLAAMVHARRSAANGQAAHYGETAYRLTDESWWTGAYHLIYRSRLLWCECLLTTADLKNAAIQLDDLIGRTNSALDRSSVYRLYANLRTLRSDYEGAIDAALLGLDLLGVNLKRGATREELDKAYQDVKRSLGDREISSLRHLPEMTDPRIKCAMGLLTTLISSIFTRDGLRFLHMAKMVELTLQYGTTSESAYGLSWFGVMIASLYDDYRDGFAYGQAALALVEQHGYEEQHTATLVAVDQISPWTQPMSYSLQRIHDAIRIGHAAGDVGMTCYARNHLVSDLIIMGHHLAGIAKEAIGAITLTRQLNYKDIEYLVTSQLNLVRTLSGWDDGSLPEVDWTFGGEKIVATSTVFWVQLYKGVAYFYDGAYREATGALREAAELIPLLAAHIDTAYCSLFLALSLAKAEDAYSPGSEVDQTLQYLRGRFATWAELNPETFQNKLLLIEAELARLNGDHDLATALFERSVLAAEASRFVHEQALAYELAGNHNRQLGRVLSTRFYIQAALEAYQRWGADRKAGRLREEFADILDSNGERSASYQIPLDQEAVVAASQALSEEVFLDRLIETLMKSMLVHAGANRALLVSMNDGELSVEAIAWIEGEDVVVNTTGLPLEGTIPYSIIDAVMSTRQPLVLADARLDGQEFHGPYFNSRPTRSVLCVPLLKRGSLVGFIYLQNDLVAGVFTEGKIALLKLLATQAAISLENARLYANLVEENELRVRSETQLGDARAELERKAKLTALGSMAASITHEIGQPLAAISASASASLRWLRRPEPDIGEAVIGLEGIKEGMERVGEIIRSLRALSKQAPQAAEPIDVDSLIEQVILIARSEIETSQTRVVTRLGMSNQTVIADATQIKQVILNLLTNAIEAMGATPPQDRQLVISTEPVDGGGVRVTVRDFGPGISDALHAKVFDPMFTTKESGMGMGLAICRSIVEAHGGNLTVEPANPGTVFSFSIGLAPRG